MNSQNPESGLVGRRAELMAELFLQEFSPRFLSRPTAEVGYDLLAGFENTRKGINTFAIEVKSTESPPGPEYKLSKATYDRIRHSNIPGLLLVADVKNSRMYYAWLGVKEPTGSASVSVELTEVTDVTRKQLRAQLVAPTEHPAVVGVAG